VVRRGEDPIDIRAVQVPNEAVMEKVYPTEHTGPRFLVNADKLLAKIGLVESVSEAARKRKAGALALDGEKVVGLILSMRVGVHTVQLGKKWCRVIVE